jgi:hypothetical protein
VERDWKKGTISLSVVGKINKMLDLMHMADCDPKHTVGESGKPLRAREATGEVLCDNPELYRSAVGSLQWISRMARPDIAQRTNELSRFNHDPSVSHWKALRHLVAYVKGSRERQLVFTKSDKCQGRFLGFVDADYAPDYGDEYANHKSTTGWMFMYNNTAFCWKSRRQGVLASSSTAAEFIAAADASKQAVWLRRVFADLGYEHSGSRQCCLKTMKLVRS